MRQQTRPLPFPKSAASGAVLNGTLGTGAATDTGGGNTAIRRIRRPSKSVDCLLCKVAGAKPHAENIDNKRNAIPIGFNIIGIETIRSTAPAQEKLVPPQLTAGDGTSKLLLGADYPYAQLAQLARRDLERALRSACKPPAGSWEMR